MIIYDAKKTWLTSDTHYNHQNICKATSAWNTDEISEGHAGVRNFDSLLQMNDTLVNNINKYVQPDDTLFHLGDWSFGGIEYIFEFRKRIYCKNVYLILGNHDHHIENNKRLPESQQLSAVEYITNYLENSDLIMNGHAACMKDLFTEVCHVKQIKVQFNQNQKAIPIFLSHYSHRVWDNHHKGWLHAFGHSHGALDIFPNGKSTDVGVDAAFKLFKEYKPFSIKEFTNICNDREIQKLDHHV